ncbi:response regulator [Maribellus sp. YY47]|uniref:response regulator n=1 Tax=Maribellus sp. YY47 TaxID=2929486 RepID=UPI002000AF2B|nr:response regulator [Maribellus sp. YY47]MCK3683738.1 response regulator [Maribellus sp. YY47]
MQKTKNPLIFIIEDSVVYKDLIVGYLQSKKYTNLKVYQKGEECIRDLHLKPDLIILDYLAASMTGLDLMVKVKREHPEVDFIFLSGQNDLEIAVQIMKIGAADYIVKNDKAPQKLVKSIESLSQIARHEKQAKGFKIGVVGFFVLLFLFIMVIIFMSIFLDFEF